MNASAQAFIPKSKQAPVQAPVEDPLTKAMKEKNVPEEDQGKLKAFIEALRAVKAEDSEGKRKTFKELKELIICKKEPVETAFSAHQVERVHDWASMDKKSNFQRNQNRPDDRHHGAGRGRGYNKPYYNNNQEGAGEGDAMKIGGHKPQNYNRPPLTEEELFARKEADQLKLKLIEKAKTTIAKAKLDKNLE